MVITAKVSETSGRTCSDTVATSIDPAAESRRVGLDTVSSAVDKTDKGVGVGTVATSTVAGETYSPVCSETAENPASAGDERKPFSWDTAAILAVGETGTTGCEVAKVEMEKKQGESPAEQNTNFNGQRP